MAGWDDVRRIAFGLPETSERTSHGNVAWRVRDKLFVWERPLRRADLLALGDAAPTGAILGARVEHVGAKEALLADDSGVYFTTPHFDGYPAILVRLDEIRLGELEEVIVEAWLAQAPKRLAKEYSESHLEALEGSGAEWSEAGLTRRTAPASAASAATAPRRSARTRSR